MLVSLCLLALLGLVPISPVGSRRLSSAGGRSRNGRGSRRHAAARCRRVLSAACRTAAATGKAVVFAEAGFPPTRGGWTSPHEENSGRPFAPEDAARGVPAVFTALGRQNWWRGVYWWKVFSDGHDADRSDRGFNFLGRPAGDAIAAGFWRLAAAETGSR